MALTMQQQQQSMMIEQQAAQMQSQAAQYKMQVSPHAHWTKKPFEGNPSGGVVCFLHRASSMNLFRCVG